MLLTGFWKSENQEGNLIKNGEWATQAWMYSTGGWSTTLCRVRWICLRRTMTDNIMFYPAIVLMIVEAGALAFLIRAWFRAKKEAEDEN